MKALVLAGGDPQIRLIEELKRRGYYTLLADYTEHPVAEMYADKFYRESTLDLEAIRKIAISEEVDMIITCCTDQALNTVSVIAEELNLPCYINKKTGLAVTNKQYMKQIFVQNGIPTASFQIVQQPEQCKINNFPIVVKPVDCNSSKGVRKVFNEKELYYAVKEAVSFSRTGNAVVEAFIEGKEISVDLFVQHGKANVLCVSFSDKIQDAHKFVIYKGQYPAYISSVVLQKIEITAQKIVDAFELINCPMLMQVLVKDDNIFVVEFSARTGGCIKYRLIELASGVDVIKATVDLFDGKTSDIHIHMSDKHIVNEFVYCQKGEFDHLSGVDECIAEGFLKEVHLLKTKGSQFEAVNSSGDRIAAIIYQAESYEDYVQKHNAVIKRLKVIDKDGKDIMRHDLLPAL